MSKNELVFSEKKIVLAFIVWLLALGLLPLGLSTYYLGLLTQILIYSIFAMSFDLLLGYLGMLSFGQHAFWGIGAYTLGISTFQGLTDNFFGYSKRSNIDWFNRPSHYRFGCITHNGHLFRVY